MLLVLSVLLNVGRDHALQSNTNLDWVNSFRISQSSSLGWPVAGMGSVTDPDQFGMFGTRVTNVLHTPKSFGFESITAELRSFL